MPKKSKKRRRKKSSSSSSEQDEKEERVVTRKHKSTKRKKDGNSEERKQKDHASVSVKEDSQSSRQIKKAVYRLPTSQATDQKPVNKGGEYSKSKHISVPFCGDNCSGKAKRDNSGRETVQGRPSKSLSIDSASTVPQRQERTSTGSSNEKSSRRSPSRLKKQLMSPSLVSTEQKSSTSAKCTTSESSSNVWKNVTSIPGKATSVSHKTKNSSCSQEEICFFTSRLPVKFKIPKKVKTCPVDSTVERRDAISTSRNARHGTELSNPGTLVNNSKKETVKHAPVTPVFTCKEQDEKPSSSGQFPAASNTNTAPSYDQKQLVEELHLARCEKSLEVDVMLSYGELTCMDIDPPEEGATDTLCKQPLQQALILILDTNILLSHLDYVKRMRSHGLGALGSPVVLIPWVVLQELDSLKKGRGLKDSVAHLACPAISFIYNSLKSRDPYLWGQSMQQATDSSNGLNTENNDDRVLQCCLQYQSLYPECALILCTNDKNLCNKAILSGVKAHSKDELEAEVRGSRLDPHLCKNSQIPTPPPAIPQVSPVPRKNFMPVQPHSQERTSLSVGAIQKVRKQLIEGDEERRNLDLSSCVSELENCLREVLSDVLEVEMKAAYEDLWHEILYLKPPWTLLDVLKCMQKHWVAVFGFIVPRKKLQTVLNLINFFNSGNSVDCSATLAAFQEAEELVVAFEKRSSRVSSALSVMDNIFHKLQPQRQSPTLDVVMNDEDEDKQPTSSQVTHQEVWAMFENIWSNVCQISFEVFKALGFDPQAMQTAQPAGGPPPPQDAVACLQKLSSMVSQLLQAFSSVLSSAPSLEEVQILLSIIQSNKIVDVDSRFAAKDLLDCFSQQDYREKLRLGGTQLMGLKEALDHCVETTHQQITYA